MIELQWIIRAVHIVAAATWVGGSVFYLIAVLPALRKGGSAPSVAAQIAESFKGIIRTCVGILLLSGVYLTFDRLTRTTLGLPYMVILALKIAGAIAMFMLAIYLGQSNLRRLAKRSTKLSRAAPQLMLALGILVFILGALLNNLFEIAGAPR